MMLESEYYKDYIGFCEQLTDYGLDVNYHDIWWKEYKKLPSYKCLIGSGAYGKAMDIKYKITYENSMNRILEQRLGE